MTDEQKKITNEELANLIAAKLVYFASVLPGDDTIKQSFVDAMSQMSLEEAAKFCAQLEDVFVNNQTRQFDDALKAKLKEIKQENEKAQMDLVDKTLKDLSDFSAEIDAMNQSK